VSVESWKFIFDWVALIGVLVTLVSGIGALWTGNIINHRQEEQLRGFNVSLIAANDGLFKQQERAAKAEGNIALAEQHSAEANAKAEGFRLDIAKANESASQAQERAANLERENVTLQQKLANRRLTKAQHDFLVDFLSKRRGTIIIESMGDSESGMYAADFLKTFTDAGWTNGGTFFPLGKVWIGLIVYLSADPDALTIADSLKGAGIPFSIGNEKRDKATILIGGKAPMF